MCYIAVSVLLHLIAVLLMNIVAAKPTMSKLSIHEEHVSDKSVRILDFKFHAMMKIENIVG